MIEKNSSTNQNNPNVGLKILKQRANQHISTIDVSIKQAQDLCELKVPVKPETYEKIRNCVMCARQVNSAVIRLAREMTKIISSEFQGTEDFDTWQEEIAKLEKESANKNEELFGLASIIAGWFDITFTKQPSNA